MKIININQSDKMLGGSDIYWKDLSRLLKFNGNQVVEFSSSEINESLPKDVDLKSPNPKNIIKFFYNNDAKIKLNKLANGEKVDIAHLNIYYGKLTTSILDALKSHDIPIVQTLHEYKLSCPVYTMNNNGSNCDKCSGGKYYNCVINNCNKNNRLRSIISTAEQYFSRFNGSEKKIDHFICVSNYQREKLIGMGENPDKLSVVHNFIDCNLFTPEDRGLGYFLYFGRIEKVKGIDSLIEAVYVLKNKYKINVKLKIAGEGTYISDCKKKSLDKGLSNNIEFLGLKNKKEITDLINGCICSIVPSIWGETFGLTVVETMALKKPVIISNIGGMTEIIENEKTGLVFEPHDSEKLALLMANLYNNIDYANELGCSARKHVESEFSPSAHYDKLVRIYTKVINGCSN